MYLITQQSVKVLEETNVKLPYKIYNMNVSVPTQLEVRFACIMQLKLFSHSRIRKHNEVMYHYG